MRKFQKMLFTPLVFSALFIASIGFLPASSICWYQPVPPEKKVN